MSVAAQLWKELRPILIKVNEGMKCFLKVVCSVNEFHPLISTYNIVDQSTEIATGVQGAINRKNDDHFKKEKKKNIKIEGMKEMTRMNC